MKIISWEESLADARLFFYEKGAIMEINELLTYLFTPVAQVAVIIGLAEIIKRAGLDKRYIPMVDIVLGLISGIFVYGYVLDYGIADGIILGIALGLSACGLFSGVKNTLEGRDDG
jgi:hypothetical protein